jgi:hypothetical protein
MTFTPVAIGSALVWVFGGILVQVRAAYLNRMSQRINIDESSHFQLVHAKWAYSISLLALVLGSIVAFEVFRGGGMVRILIGGVFSAAMIGFGIWEFKNLRRARLTIADGKVTYTDGSEVREIVAEDVISVSIYWSWFRVILPVSDNQPKPPDPAQESKEVPHDIEFNAFQKWLLSKKQCLTRNLSKRPFKTVLIPATLERSEITLAFLRQAAARNATLSAVTSRKC